MSDFEGLENYDIEDDVSLDIDEQNAGGDRQIWLKMNKGQIVRGSFVFFHTFDTNAVQAAVKKARKAGTKPSREDIQEVAKKALIKRAEDLKKGVDQLTPAEKLDITSVHFKVIKAHYQEGLGYVLSRLGKDGVDADAIWKRLPEPKTYFSVLFLVYPTDQDGAEINKELLASQIKQKKLKLIPWRFGKNMYEAIWKLNDGLRENGLSLASQDIRLECKEAQFQKIEIQAKGPAIWQKNETFKEVALASAVTLYDKLVPFREMSTDQLRVKLSLGGPSVDDVSSDNFQDMLSDV